MQQLSSKCARKVEPARTKAELRHLSHSTGNGGKAPRLLTPLPPGPLPVLGCKSELGFYQRPSPLQLHQKTGFTPVVAPVL